mgnify:FL=1
MDISKFIRGVPDFPKKGILFYDITPLMLNSEAYSQAIDEMAAKISATNPTKILAAESRGFFFGPMIALRLKLPFVPVRKKNKLPCKTICVEYALEYGTDSLCIHDDAVSSSDRVAVVDDILATGGTAEAMCKMCEIAWANVACCAFFMELSFLHGRDRLGGKTVVSIFEK